MARKIAQSFRIRSGYLLAGAAVGVLIATVAGIAVAAVPDEDGVIHGCYFSSSRFSSAGYVRVIDSETQSCRRSEAALSWNQAGQAGDPGVDGTSVTVEEEPAGANCAGGGQKLTSASGTSYICNGTGATPQSAGSIIGGITSAGLNNAGPSYIAMFGSVRGSAPVDISFVNEQDDDDSTTFSLGCGDQPLPVYIIAAEPDDTYTVVLDTQASEARITAFLDGDGAGDLDDDINPTGEVNGLEPVDLSDPDPSLRDELEALGVDVDSLAGQVVILVVVECQSGSVDFLGQVIPASGRVSNLYARLGSAPDNGDNLGNSREITVVKNENPTVLSCSVTGLGVDCSDLVNEVCFEAGDQILIRTDPVGVPNPSAGLRWTALFVPGSCA